MLVIALVAEKWFGIPQPSANNLVHTTEEIMQIIFLYAGRDAALVAITRSDFFHFAELSQGSRSLGLATKILGISCQDLTTQGWDVFME